MRLCRVVRSAGWNVELYPEAKRLGNQLKYADEHGFSIALVAGSNELDAGQVQVKNLKQKIAATVVWSPNSQPLLDCITDFMAMNDGTRIA
jgi:histidyl-tRNA synthetase